jgi:membrane protein DedA with SNARE-associated domain
MHALPDLIAQASSWFAQYGAITVFLGSVFIGETAIIPFFVLAAQGLIDIYVVTLCAYAAVVLTDVFWFYVGVLSRRNRHLHRHYEKRISPHLKVMLNKLFGKRVLLSLILMKFMYGSRMLNLIWLGFRRFELSEFLLLDIISAFVYILALAALAGLINIGIGFATSAIQVLGIIGIAVAALMILYQVIHIMLLEA